MPSARLGERQAAVVIGVVAAATITGALASQYVFGLIPCKLCLEQRIPYYVGVPLALITAAAPRRGWQRTGLGLLTVVFAISAVLGAYHAGVEWGWFLGPSDCGGGAGAPPAQVEDFLNSLNRIKVVSCTDAAFRFLGLSLAGWNALISAGLASLAAWTGLARR